MWRVGCLHSGAELLDFIPNMRLTKTFLGDVEHSVDISRHDDHLACSVITCARDVYHSSAVTVYSGASFAVPNGLALSNSRGHRSSGVGLFVSK